METYKIEFLSIAWEDLKAISDWYCIQFDETIAMKGVNHILDTIERLSLITDSGSLTPDKWLNDMGYRMVVCEKYVVIYKYISDVIYIYHIANTQTEYTKLFYV